MGVVSECESVVVAVGRQVMVCGRDIRAGRCGRCRTEEGYDEQQPDRRPQSGVRRGWYRTHDGADGSSGFGPRRHA